MALSRIETKAGGGLIRRSALAAAVVLAAWGAVPTYAQDPCEVVDNGTGTVTLPPEGCAYLSPDEVHMIIDGLPPGTTIELDAIHRRFICKQEGIPQENCNFPGGSLGGEVETFLSTGNLSVTGTGDLAGYTRQIDIPLNCVVHSGPRNPGDPVQTFDTEMMQLQGSLFGDPDFQELHFVAGTSNGLPSPGQTTLTQLPGGSFQVDSFFDIEYRIDFVGAPGGAFAGATGSTTGTIHMAAAADGAICPLPSPPIDPYCDLLQTSQCNSGVAGDICMPTVIAENGDGIIDSNDITSCACTPGDLSECGPVDVNLAAGGYRCPGLCPDPPGGICELYLDGNPTGSSFIPFGDVPVGVEVTCGCPTTQPDCMPNDTGTGCTGACPDPTAEQCLTRCVNFDPLTGVATVTACDCITQGDCHIELQAPPGIPCAGTTAAVAGPNGCVATPSGGTVQLPPAGCSYLSPNDVHEIIAGLPAGTTIELGVEHTKFFVQNSGPGGSLGGEFEQFNSVVIMSLCGTGELGGFSRFINIPIQCETHTGPRTPGDPVQDFDTEMFMLQGELFGDPDFDLLRVRGGTAFGLPSPGHTTLTELPGGDFVVDSFFDIAYEIEFQGAPGSALEGMAGTTTATIRMSTGGVPFCEGNCPPGQTCVETSTVQADGTIDICCDCVDEVTEACCVQASCFDVTVSECLALGGTPQGPGTVCLGDLDGNGLDDACDCRPTPAGDACKSAFCPDDPATQECLARCAIFDPITATTMITDCECIDGQSCHLELVGGTGANGVAAGNGNACVVPDNGGGTVTLPPAGCSYLTADEVHMIVDGLPAGTTIELDPIHTNFICQKGGASCSLPIPPGTCEIPGGALGGNGDCFDSTLDVTVSGTGTLAGFNRTLSVPVQVEVHTAPRNPGDPIQDFDTDMRRIAGELFGDPDFCMLRVTGGTDNGLPSPGHTTLTQLPSGDFQVDSFFDIAYRIEFQGCPGSVLDGLSGTTEATVRMKTGGKPACTGDCPPGTTCVENTVVNADGTFEVCCDCVPNETEACCFQDGSCADVPVGDCTANGGTPQGAGTVCLGDLDGNGIDDACDCRPDPTGSFCEPSVCPPSPVQQECYAKCATFDPLTAQTTITDCDCVNFDQCHLELVGGTGAGGAGGVAAGNGNACVVNDNGSGTVTLPPAGCAYLSPDEVHMIVDGLPAGTTIELEPIHTNFICQKGGASCSLPIPPGTCEIPGGALGGNGDCFDSTLDLQVSGTGSLAGFNRSLSVPVQVEVHTAPRNPGDPVQDFDTDMRRVQGELFGDPDFCTLRITGGTDNGLPSPGHTTLTQLPSGDFHVDSFFDIEYRIEFQGCPGSPLDGLAGTTEATIRMSTGGKPKCFGDCPPGTVCNQTTVVNADGNIDVCCECIPLDEACCLPDGSCALLSVAACVAAGGTPQGAGSVCLGVEACCLSDGTCADVDRLCCEDLGGTSQGPGSACSPDPVACCIQEPGTTIFTCIEADPLCCQSLGGTPGPAGSACDPEGACCYDADGDGVNESCDVMAEACCANIGGTFQGANTVCQGTGACCLQDGTCNELDQLCCEDLGGTFQGVGTVCLGDANGNMIDDACEEPVCPLPDDGVTIPICQSLQADQCISDDPNLRCLPRLLIVPTPGELFPELCECTGTDELCGPIGVRQGPAGLEVSCENACPSTDQDCLVHVNGNSTGQTTVPALAIPANSTVTCECASGCPQPDPARPENKLGATCTIDADCPNEASCINNECYVPKNKYISFIPGNPGQFVGIRVTMVSSTLFPALVGSEWWVQPNQANDPAKTFRLGCNKHYQDWSLAPFVVHVGDRHITPGAEYVVEMLIEGCPQDDPNSFSAPLRLPTVNRWGDIVGPANSPPNGIVNFDDIFGAVQAFQGIPGAPNREWADVDGDVPNATVNLADVFRIVQAFQGTPYPYPGPVPCP